MLLFTIIFSPSLCLFYYYYYYFFLLIIISLFFISWQYWVLPFFSSFQKQKEKKCIINYINGFYYVSILSVIMYHLLDAIASYCPHPPSSGKKKNAARESKEEKKKSKGLICGAQRSDVVFSLLNEL